MELKEQLVRVLRVLQDWMELKAHKVLMAHRALMAHKEPMEPKAQQVTTELKAHKA